MYEEIRGVLPVRAVRDLFRCGTICREPPRLSPVSTGKGDLGRYIDRRSSTKGYRMTFIAAPLIVGAAVRDLGVVPA